jgi:hypothetical protein
MTESESLMDFEMLLERCRASGELAENHRLTQWTEQINYLKRSTDL